MSRLVTTELVLLWWLLPYSSPNLLCSIPMLMPRPARSSYNKVGIKILIDAKYSIDLLKIKKRLTVFVSVPWKDLIRHANNMASYQYHGSYWIQPTQKLNNEWANGNGCPGKTLPGQWIDHSDAWHYHLNQWYRKRPPESAWSSLGLVIVIFWL